MADKTTPLMARRSYRDGMVIVTIDLRCNGSYASATARINAQTELTTTQARALAASLIEQADVADAKAAKKAEAEERRKKWREREIAAGRMVVFSPGAFLQR